MNENKIKETVVDSRIKKILQMRIDPSSIIDSLESISNLYQSNNLDSRRSLRQNLERQNLQIATKTLNEFQSIFQSVCEVETHALQLESSFQQISFRIQSAESNMNRFIQKASELESQREILKVRSHDISNFLLRYQLSDREIQILYSGELTDKSQMIRFFQSISRLQDSISDCQHMVETNCFPAGFELLESLFHHKEIAFQRLFEWVRDRCISNRLDDDDDSNFQSAIHYLYSVSSLYEQCRVLVTGARRSRLVQRFVLALTQGGSEGEIFRAIDLHSHDILRYLGDILAWVHLTVASEVELLRSLFPEDKDLPDLLSRCLQGLGRPLRVRLNQSLESKQSLETLFSLVDLLAFYEVTLSALLSSDNPVLTCIRDGLSDATKQLTQSTSIPVDTFQSSPSLPDLSVSPSIKSCCRQVRELLKAFQNCKSPTTSRNPSEPLHINSIISSIVQPALQSSRTASQHLSPSESAAFVINSILALQAEFLEFARNHPKESDPLLWPCFKSLQSEMQTCIDLLIQKETTSLLEKFDFPHILELLSLTPHGISSPLSKERLSISLNSFYSCLSLPFLVCGSAEKLSDADLRAKVRKLCSESLSHTYEQVYESILSRGDSFDSSILSHSPQEVRVLLGCKGP